MIKIKVSAKQICISMGINNAITNENRNHTIEYVTIDVKSLVPFSPVRTTRTLRKCAIARRVFWNRVI